MWAVYIPLFPVSLTPSKFFLQFHRFVHAALTPLFWWNSRRNFWGETCWCGMGTREGVLERWFTEQTPGCSLLTRDWPPVQQGPVNNCDVCGSGWRICKTPAEFSLFGPLPDFSSKRVPQRFFTKWSLVILVFTFGLPLFLRRRLRLFAGVHRDHFNPATSLPTKQQKNSKPKKPKKNAYHDKPTGTAAAASVAWKKR